MRVLIKICGVTDAPALDAAIDSGADLVGFVFFPRSPRNLDLAAAARLSARARGRIERVALTVDAGDAEIGAIVEAVRPDWLQLHGQEDPRRVAALRQRFSLPVMKAVPVAAAGDVAAARAYVGIADRLLFDARPPRDATRPGGLGQVFDWTLLEQFREAPFFLSGGLHAGNVAEALRVTQAAGIDVSSGVERAPGEKGPDLIRAFVRAARAATGQTSRTLEGAGP